MFDKLKTKKQKIVTSKNEVLNTEEQELIMSVDGNKTEWFRSTKIVGTLILVGIAVLSVILFSKMFSNVEMYSESIALLDDKKFQAMAITAAITAAAAIFGTIVDGFGQMLSSLTMPLILIVGVVYFEKFFLTIGPFLAFTYVIPVACFLGIAGIWMDRNWMKQFALKLSAFAIVMMLLVPTSVTVTKLVDQTFNESINKTYEKAEQVEKTEDKGGLISQIKDSLEEKKEEAKNKVNNFVDAIAVLLITTCGIPLLVIFFFMWVIKLVFGIEIPTDGIKKTMKINPLKESKKLLKKK